MERRSSLGLLEGKDGSKLFAHLVRFRHDRRASGFSLGGSAGIVLWRSWHRTGGTAVPLTFEDGDGFGLFVARYGVMR